MSNSLPPKPDSSSSRFDDRDRRTSRNYPHATEDRHPRRWPAGGDSFHGAYYDRREDHFPRSHWDRPRPRESDTHYYNSEHDRDRRGLERGPYGSDYDRGRRRGFESESYDRRTTHYGYDPRYSGRQDYPPRRSRSRSRSPARRDRFYRSRSRTPPPPKRLKLGSHSLDHSPRRSSTRRYSRSRSRGPLRPSRSKSPSGPPTSTKFEEDVKSNVVRQSMTNGANAEIPSKSAPLPDLLIIKQEDDVDHKRPAEDSSKPRIMTQPVTLESLPDDQPTPAQPSFDQDPVLNSIDESMPDVSSTGAIKPSPHLIFSTHSQTIAPPTQPRPKSPSPRLHAPHPRRGSRSPPRGPRKHLGAHTKGHVTPTGPASSLPPGPHGQRRTFTPSNAFSHSLPPEPTSQSHSPVTLSPVENAPNPALELAKVPLPTIPIKSSPLSLTDDLDKMVRHLHVHRTHLVSEYMTISKEMRRTLHELEMTTIDLRAAELRRKVADAQHEQARNGLLGMDYGVVDYIDKT